MDRGVMKRRKERTKERRANQRVYVLASDGLPGIVKIGYSFEPVRAAVVLQGALGLRHPVDVAWESEVVPGAAGIVAAAGATLDAYRASTAGLAFPVSGQHSFYRVSADVAVAAIQTAMGDDA